LSAHSSPRQPCIAIAMLHHVPSSGVKRLFDIFHDHSPRPAGKDGEFGSGTRKLKNDFPDYLLQQNQVLTDLFSGEKGGLIITSPPLYGKGGCYG
jgi:hypothetical protein